VATLRGWFGQWLGSLRTTMEQAVPQPIPATSG
jgi:hypothetical protein